MRKFGKKTRLHFEDHGQDFLWWDIDAEGNVIDCGPFQASVWVGCKVATGSVSQGCPPFFKSKQGKRMSLNYPVEKIEILEP